MGSEQKQVDVCLVGIITLGIASITLLITSAAVEWPTARWGLLVAIVASSWTVVYAIGRAARRIVRATAREIALATRDDDTPTGDTGMRVVR
jgi:hypothetical protein